MDTALFISLMISNTAIAMRKTNQPYGCPKNHLHVQNGTLCWRVSLLQINAQENQIQKANATITTMQDEMKHMRSKVEEALKLIAVTKKLEEKIVTVQHRQASVPSKRTLLVAIMCSF